MNNSYLFKAALALVAGLGLLAPQSASADDFTLEQQRSSLGRGTATRTTVESGNTRTAVNGINFVNTGTETLTDLFYITPFLWVLSEQRGVLGLEWENELKGWTTDDYDGLGNSLTLRLNNSDGEIRLGALADFSGEAAFPLTAPCSFSPSCLPPRPGIPTLSQDADDVVPFISLGDLAPGEEIALDVSLDYEFEDGRIGSLLTLPGFAVFRRSQDVPEPMSVVAVLAVSGGLLVSRRKSTVSRQA